MHLLRLNFAVIQLFNYFWSPRAKKKPTWSIFSLLPFFHFFVKDRLIFLKFFFCVCVYDISSN